MDTIQHITDLDSLKRIFTKSFLDVVTKTGWHSTDDMMYTVNTLMWGEPMNKITTYGYASYMKERLTSVGDTSKCVHHEEKEDDKYDAVIVTNTLLNVRKHLEDTDTVFFEIRHEQYPIIITENHEIIMDYGCVTYIGPSETFPKWFEDCLVFPDEDVYSYEYMTYDKDGFDTMPLSIKRTDVDVKLNYNDDLPDSQIKAFLSGDESGLIVLHGKPGTGKSSYIRHLITTVDNKFVYLDQSTFDSITDASFIRTLSEYENGIIILEDCESMLMGRQSGNSKIAALLNITDGLIGDSFKFKVLCTFNADIGKIDKALTRKGRLKVKYEFKELCEEKSAVLAEKVGWKDAPRKKMLLADIYNFEDDAYVSSEEKGIGFFN